MCLIIIIIIIAIVIKNSSWRLLAQACSTCSSRAKCWPVQPVARGQNVARESVMLVEAIQNEK